MNYYLKFFVFLDGIYSRPMLMFKNSTTTIKNSGLRLVLLHRVRLVIASDGHTDKCFYSGAVKVLESTYPHIGTFISYQMS